MNYFKLNYVSETCSICKFSGVQTLRIRCRDVPVYIEMEFLMLSFVYTNMYILLKIFGPAIACNNQIFDETHFLFTLVKLINIYFMPSRLLFSAVKDHLF